MNHEIMIVFVILHHIPASHYGLPLLDGTGRSIGWQLRLEGNVIQSRRNALGSNDLGARAPGWAAYAYLTVGALCSPVVEGDRDRNHADSDAAQFGFLPADYDQCFPGNFAAAFQQLHETLPEHTVGGFFNGSVPHLSQEPLHFLVDLSGLLMKHLSGGCFHHQIN
jgi:hypothetical protein